MTHLGGFEIDEYVVIIVYRMRVRVRALSTALKIFSTDKTAVDVDIRERYGTDFLEIEIEDGPIDLE